MRAGFFAFTIIENLRDPHPYTLASASAVNLYYHHKNYIKNLSDKYKFTFLFEQTFTTLKDLVKKETLDYKLIVFRKE